MGFATVRQERTWASDDIALLRVAAEIFANVLERRRVEARLEDSQRLESIGRLAAGVAHDLNNMLTPILNYSELLLDELQAADVPRSWITQIAAAAKRSRDLVRQLLAFSRKQLLDLKPVDLRKIVRDLEALLRRTIREDVELKVVVSAQPCRIRADIGQIAHILMHLAVNAQDAMHGGGALHVEVGPVELDAESLPDDVEASPGPYARLAVSDTGCGMDERTRSHVFEPFFTTKAQGEGTGMGLPSVYGIVKQHGGFISLSSQPGRGTRFEVYLPRVTSPPTPLPIAIDQPGPMFAPGTTVMVVEDDDMVRGLVVALLVRNGCTVLSSRSGKECLELLKGREGEIDLLLTDVIMPGMNGRQLFVELVRRLAALQADPGLRVLYMTGYADSAVADLGVLEEGSGFIQKPFSLDVLLAKIREVLGR
jgi:two-component system, cell cycle sensor histidine kinase and response regulator CckA